MPWFGVSKHQKYFLQLVACGKNPSPLHLNAGPVLGVVGGAGVVEVCCSPRPPEFLAGCGFGGRGGGGRTTPWFLKFGVVPLLRRWIYQK